MKFKESSNAASNPHLVKLKAGDSVTGVLRGEPVDYERAFKPGDKPTFRFRLNIVMKENGALTAKILEGGWKMYCQLRELSKSGWDLTKSYVRISRQGAQMNDTVYSVTVLPTPIPPESLLQIEKVQLRDLSPDTAPQAAAPSREPGADDAEMFSPF